MIEAQIQYSKIQAISRQMGENMQRISRSPLVSEDRSFATAIFTGELELAVQDGYEPEHLFALKESIDHLFERSEEHTSELQSRGHLVCRLLLEKKKY